MANFGVTLSEATELRRQSRSQMEFGNEGISESDDRGHKRFARFASASSIGVRVSTVK